MFLHSSILDRIGQHLDHLARVRFATVNKYALEVLKENTRDIGGAYKLGVLFESLAKCGNANKIRIVLHSYLDDLVVDYSKFRNTMVVSFGSGLCIHDGILLEELEWFYNLGIDECIVWTYGFSEKSRFAKKVVSRLRSALPPSCVVFAFRH